MPKLPSDDTKANAVQLAIELLDSGRMMPKRMSFPDAEAMVAASIKSLVAPEEPTVLGNYPAAELAATS